ncbi:MAG TPA: amino acid permease [Acidimicrobiales bacterium]|nr:amino acid permease [Acidimicrobiales bacterium]
MSETVSTAVVEDADSRHLATLGYKQELRRVLGLFENFAVAFCYLSPMVGIYSLFALGLGTAGPAYLWLMPVVVLGQLFVALIFAELGSSYPIAGALFQWGKNLMGPGYGWWVGWIYGWALMITVASVDTGVVIYASPLLNSLFGMNINAADPNTILLFTVIAVVLQFVANAVGVRILGVISRYGVYVEIVGTFGIAIALAISGFHHGFGYTFTTQGTEHLATNPLGVDFGGNWLLGAALIAILAHVYIFYGFEAAGDVAEEVKNPRKRVPRAIISSLLIGGLASFVLVLALILAIPSGGKGFAGAASLSGGVPFIVGAAFSSPALQNLILGIILLAFFSCGTAVMAAASRVAFSYARDRSMPLAKPVSTISPRFRTPVNALALASVIPLLFVLLAHVSPSKPVHFLFLTYPANVTPLTLLISFGVSGIYLSFQLVVLGYIIARLRGWRPIGTFQLGAWSYVVAGLALIWGVGMLVDVLLPSGLSSPRGALFNFDWMAIAVIVLICVIGAIYYFVDRPHHRIRERMAANILPAEPAATQGSPSA